jgi:hypothetical protein
VLAELVRELLAGEDEALHGVIRSR